MSLQPGSAFRKHAYVSTNIIEQEDEEELQTLDASITNMNYKRSPSAYRNTFMGATQIDLGKSQMQYVDVQVEELPEEELKQGYGKFKWSSLVKGRSSIAESMIEDSHSKCKFCKSHFDKLPKDEILQLKKNMIKGKVPPPPVDKEEEYFKMSLISYQMIHKVDNRVICLDFRTLYNRAKSEKIPFFKYNSWLARTIEQMQFEEKYRRKAEFEYTKILTES